MLKKFLALSILLSGLSLSLGFTLHKYYVSLTEVEYRADLNTIQIINSMFIDDLQLALNETYNQNLEIGVSDQNIVDSLSFDYFTRHFSIESDGRDVNFSLLTSEMDLDEMFLYIEAEQIQPFDKLVIENQLLIPNFPEQTNIVKVKVGKQNKSALLRRGDSTTEMKFNKTIK